jgi:hypothetical protein
MNAVDTWIKDMKESVENSRMGLEGKRYCNLCKKSETQQECKFGPEMWKRFSIATVHPANMPEEKDHEHSMARSELSTAMSAIKRLQKRMKGEGNIEAWVQSKITKASDYLDTAADYLDSGESKVDEEAKHGLYYNVNKRKEKGLPPKKPGQEGYPTAKAWKESEKTAKKEEYTFNEDLKQARKNVGASKCWPGKVAKGTKMKGGKEVPNCVPAEDTCITFSQFMQLAEASPAWQRKEGKNPEGGLNKKGIASYRKEHPGSKLSLAVTKKPSELKAGSKSANRRKSFCARMSGMKAKLTSAKTAHDPDSRINKSLRKWNC